MSNLYQLDLSHLTTILSELTTSYRQLLHSNNSSIIDSTYLNTDTLITQLQQQYNNTELYTIRCVTSIQSLLDIIYNLKLSHAIHDNQNTQQDKRSYNGVTNNIKSIDQQIHHVKQQIKQLQNSDLT